MNPATRNVPQAPPRPPCGAPVRQVGKALQRLTGDHRLIIYPDGGAAPLKAWSLLRHRARMRDGYGSHRNGRHKMG